MDRVQEAVEFLGAEQVEEGWKYFDDATQNWYVCEDESDLEHLWSLIHDGEPDAYSRWCSDTSHSEYKGE